MRAATILAGLLTIAAAGCASADGQAPAWFAERQADDAGGYPSLREVPTGTSANTDADYWAAVEADLRAAGAAVREHPRSEPASATQSPEEFIAEAQQDLEEARQAHAPN